MKKTAYSPTESEIFSAEAAHSIGAGRLGTNVQCPAVHVAFLMLN
jgi:hypothetical protein